MLLDRDSHVGLFTDVANWSRDVGIGIPEADEGFPAGFGGVVQVSTPAGITRVSIGIAAGSAVEEATVSVALAGRF